MHLVLPVLTALDLGTSDPGTAGKTMELKPMAAQIASSSRLLKSNNINKLKNYSPGRNSNLSLCR